VSFLSRIVAPPSERRTFSSSLNIPSNADGYGSDAGEYVSERSALRLIPVYACVRLLADSIAMLPMSAYRRKVEVREPVDPAPRVVKQHMPGMTNFDWTFQTVSSLALRGECVHVVMERDLLEYPTALLPVHPDDVRIEWDQNHRYDFSRVKYSVGGVRIPREDVIHTRLFSLPGEIRGLSPIGAAQQGIGLGLAAERYGARYFGDSANPSGVLESDGNLTEEQAQRSVRSWVNTHGGRRHPAVLSGGLKWRGISIAPDEAQFLETRKFQRGEIAMLYGVPPHMIGDTEKSTSWGTGIEQQGIGYVTYTLGPWLARIENALTDILPRGQFVKFNVSALLRGDTTARFAAYVQARNAGWLSVNEIRALEDLAPIPNGDSHIQPLNMGPLGSDPLAAKAPTTPTPQTEPDDDEESDNGS